MGEFHVAAPESKNLVTMNISQQYSHWNYTTSISILLASDFQTNEFVSTFKMLNKIQSIIYMEVTFHTWEKISKYLSNHRVVMKLI